MEEKIIIERKSKSDLFQSIKRRDNFIKRLRRMEKFSYSAVVVEDDLEGIAMRPPEFTDMNPLSIVRTIFSWDMQFKTKWWLVRGRRMGEKLTFRLLHTMYKFENQRVTRGPKHYDY
jgi:ERCC4-type nuclease